jgi:hypothetical protein
MILPMEFLMPLDTGDKSALQRDSCSGASMPRARKASLRCAHKPSVSALSSGQSYIGKAAIRSRMPRQIQLMKKISLARRAGKRFR